MLTIVLAHKMDILQIGMNIVIRKLFPNARLLYSKTARQALTMLRSYECRLLICDGALASEEGWEILHSAVLQKGIKIVLLYTGHSIGSYKLVCPYDLDGTIDLRLQPDEIASLLISVMEADKTMTG